MQQFVDAREGVLHAELSFEDGDTVAAPQCADAVGLGRSRQYTPLERLVLLGRQAGRATRRRLGRHRLHSMIAVDIAPALNEAARATEHPHDGQRWLTGNSQLDRAQSITLLGAGSLADQLLQPVRVLEVAQGDVDSLTPLKRVSLSTYAQGRNLTSAERARDFVGKRISATRSSCLGESPIKTAGIPDGI